MKSHRKFVAWISIAALALVGGCGQPGQLPVPGVGASQTLSTLRNGSRSSAGPRARYIYFAGIQSGGGQGGFLGAGELGVYAATANGNVAPMHVIAGSKTGLLEMGGCCVPQSAWFDSADGSVWTCRTFSKFIARFATNRGPSSWGNVKPGSRLAISPKTVSCGSVAIGNNGEIVADDINSAFVSTWRAGATGNAAAIRTIAGSATHLVLPSQITFDSQGDYIVSDRCSLPNCAKDEAAAILTFDAKADGNASPMRELVGAKTQLSGTNRIAYDPVHNVIYAANLNASTITGYPADSSGNVAPTIFIHGSKTHLWNPDAIAIDKAGYLYVGNEPLVPGPPPASILVFAPGANGNVAPIQIIAGSKTHLAEVNALSVH
jgi:hypothetical protein